jgi:ABC-type Fe3+/spermidine/putrescine transport system ATPase subunit
MMFQQYAVFPYMTVAQNVEHPIGAMRADSRELTCGALGEREPR